MRQSRRRTTRRDADAHAAAAASGMSRAIYAVYSRLLMTRDLRLMMRRYAAYAQPRRCLRACATARLRRFNAITPCRRFCGTPLDAAQYAYATPPCADVFALVAMPRDRRAARRVAVMPLSDTICLCFRAMPRAATLPCAPSFAPILLLILRRCRRHFRHLRHA